MEIRIILTRIFENDISCLTLDYQFVKFLENNMHFSWEMWIKSHFSKQEREYLSINLLCLRREQDIEIDFLSSSEKKLMLTRIPGIKKLCWSLISAIAMSPISNSICISTHISPFPHSIPLMEQFPQNLQIQKHFLVTGAFLCDSISHPKKERKWTSKRCGGATAHQLVPLSGISRINQHHSESFRINQPQST